MFLHYLQQLKPFGFHYWYSIFQYNSGNFEQKVDVEEKYATNKATPESLFRKHIPTFLPLKKRCLQKQSKAPKLTTRLCCWEVGTKLPLEH